jgi:hypothetical protein
LAKDFEELNVSLEWRSYQIHISPDRRITNKDGFAYMDPRRLLKKG